ncbi:putative zinc finger dna-binding protein [Eutypa lata UCREL1]|uniref:Putative zinc finger dna-binding protein n=1 Tax=Eutypa lata (strain UCR-EL1) TaxID=1287681 RepID=M7SVJ1_EUTLA|nr:putative zinc finger dna-binding protein [Eutypa lata UCREL1]
MNVNQQATKLSDEDDDYHMASPAPSPSTLGPTPETTQAQAQAQAPPLTQPSQQQRPRQIALPQHFLVRPGTIKHTASGPVTIPGPMVPLLPVDQLPEWMDVLGVPRALAVEQTAGLINLGTVAKGGGANGGSVGGPEFYEVHFHQPQLFMGGQRGGHGGGYRRQRLVVLGGFGFGVCFD